MSKLRFEASYKLMDVINRFGHHLPKPLLVAWISRTMPEERASQLHRAGLMNVDQFDVVVDRRIVLQACLRRKVARK